MRVVVTESFWLAVSAFVIPAAIVMTTPRMKSTTTISMSVKPRGRRGSNRRQWGSMARK